MAHAESFEDLEVYKRARILASKIYEISLTFPKEEKFSLTDQIRRSSRSVGAQISEAWAKRKYPKHFINKLSDADGEQMETRHWIYSAMDSKIMSETIAAELMDEYRVVGRQLQTMMNNSDRFCRY
jgi:four helix bundle protein